MGLENMMQQHQFERHLGSDNREPASCLMCHHHRSSSSSRVSEDAVWSFFSSEMKDGEMNGHPDKATLHQSAIEPRGSTVVSASRCLLVEVCPKGKTTTNTPYAGIDGSSPVLVLPPVRRHLPLFLSCVQLASELCLSADR